MAYLYITHLIGLDGWLRLLLQGLDLNVSLISDSSMRVGQPAELKMRFCIPLLVDKGSSTNERFKDDVDEATASMPPTARSSQGLTAPAPMRKFGCVVEIALVPRCNDFLFALAP